MTMGWRLFIAFFLIVLVTLACWYILPRVGVEFPWFVPMLCYLAIVGGTVIPMLEERSRRPPEPGPRNRSIDEVDPGPDEADLKRFGDPWLKITESERKK